MFWSSEVGSAHIRPLHHSVFVETGCLTEPGPDILSRMAGQALPGNLLSLSHVSRITGTLIHRLLTWMLGI